MERMLVIVFDNEKSAYQGESALRQLAEERADHVASEPGHARVAEIDVRDDQRAAGRLQRHVGQGLVRRHDRRAVAARALRAKRRLERLAERMPRSLDLLLGLAGRDLEREVERGVLREQPEQVVEHGHAGRDVRPAAARDVDASVQAARLVRLAGPRGHPSTRSIWAPRERSRSSIRS